MTSPRPEARPSEVRARRIGAALVFVVALGVYANSLANGFVWDDEYVILQNPPIRDLANVPSFFLAPWGAGTTHERGRTKNVGFYRPLPLATYAVDHAIHGLRPIGFHLTNAVLHALMALVVLGIARRLGLAHVPALAAALLYAVHATHAEAVDVIAYRTSLLSDGFVLAGLLAHLGAGPRARDVRRIFVVPLCYAAGLLSKESAVVLPGLLLLADVLRPAGGVRPPWRALAVSYLPLLAVAAGYFAIRAALTQPVPISYFEGVPPLGVALTMARVFGMYVRLLLVPWPLNPFYDWSLVPPARSALEPEVLGGLVLLAVYLVAVAWTFRRHRGACFLLTAYGVALLPYSHLAPFVVVAADRFLLLPSFAFAIGAAWGLGALAGRPGGTRALWWGLLTLLVVGNAVLTVRRNTHWQDDEHILRQTAADFPESFNARMRLGERAELLGDRALAEGEYRAAVALLPGLPAPSLRLAALLRDTGRATAAVEVLEALAGRTGEDPDVLDALAEALLAAGRPDAAREAVARAARARAP